MATTEDYVNKIQKLLRLAEKAGSDQEAQEAFAKAQVLMTKFAVTEAMLAEARGDEQLEPIREVRYKLHGVYSGALEGMMHSVTRANDCHPIRSPGVKSTIWCYAVGTDSDVRNVEQLWTMLELAALSSLQRWWATAKHEYEWMSSKDKYKQRRQFVLSFGYEVANRLHEAKKAGQSEAVDDEVGRQINAAAGIAEDDVRTAVNQTVALALKSKKARVDEWIDQRYGRLSKSRGGRGYSGGTGTAAAAGRQAGRQADIGLTGLRAQRRLNG